MDNHPWAACRQTLEDAVAGADMAYLAVAAMVEMSSAASDVVAALVQAVALAADC